MKTFDGEANLLEQITKTIPWGATLDNGLIFSCPLSRILAKKFRLSTYWASLDNCAVLLDDRNSGGMTMQIQSCLRYLVLS